MALAKVKRWNPFLKFGVPLISLTVLGSVALAHLQQGRKDVLTARDEKEWARMAANKALTRDGAVAGAVADAVAKKKPLDLDEELKKVKIDDFEYVRVPKPKEVRRLRIGRWCLNYIICSIFRRRFVFGVQVVDVGWILCFSTSMFSILLAMSLLAVSFVSTDFGTRWSTEY